MSKFFKALENAERERAARGSAPAEADDASTSPSATAVVSVEPPRVVEPVAPPSPQPPSHLASPVASHVASPVAAPPTTPTITSPVYGAPMVDVAPRTRRAAEDRAGSIVVHGSGELDEHLISVLAPTSLAAEQYRAVRLHLEKLRHERGTKIVAVSSPQRGDGKTLTAINLAGTLAQATDTRVALVEVEMRRPSVARSLGLSNAQGLSTYVLTDTVPMESLLVRPPGLGFTVVLAGPPVAMSYELLKSPRMRDLFAHLRERFDHVILDAPPVLPFPDVGILRDLVDGFFLVVRAHHTPRETVHQALAALGPEELSLGVIFNDDERAGSDGAEFR